MAKGLRSSVKKSNKSKLRQRVFGPVEEARTERLSAKLLELAQQAKPVRGEMDVDTEDKEQQAESATTEDLGQATSAAEDMDVDDAATTVKSSLSSSSKKSKKSNGKVQKKRHRKERNSITFKNHKAPQRKTRDKIGRA